MIKVIIVEADPVAREYVRRLVETGVYGKTADEAATLLVQEGLATAVRQGIIKYSLEDPEPKAL